MQKRVFIVIMAAALATVLDMAGCQRIVNGPEPTPVEFASGTVEPDALSVTMVITADEISKLDEMEGLVAADLRGSETLAKHADWAEELKTRYTFTAENVTDILQSEVGAVFAQVLEHAGVYKCTPEGRAAFQRFIDSVR